MKKEELKKFRMDKKLNQSEFAKFFGVTQAAVSQYENGERVIPDEVEKVVNLFPPLDKEKAALSHWQKLENVDRSNAKEKNLIMNAFVAGVDWRENFKESVACS